MREHIIHVDRSRCIGCGLCQRDCPANNILIRNKKAWIKEENCIKCGHCSAICPQAAVSFSGFDERPIELDGKKTLKPQELLDAIKDRRSIRQFKDKPVPRDIIERIIEAGRWTPTAKNAQDVSYMVLEKEKQKYERLAVAFFKKLFPLVSLVYAPARNINIDDDFFFKKAPAVILVLSRNEINGALAASNMALMAEANGLGVLYSGFFAMAVKYSHKLRKALHLNGNKVVAALVLGYPNVIYHRTVQKEKAVWRYL